MSFLCYCDLKPSAILLRPNFKCHIFPFSQGRQETSDSTLIHVYPFSSPVAVDVESAFCLRLICTFVVVQNTLVSSKIFLHPSFFFLCIHLFTGYILSPFLKKVYKPLKSLKLVKHRKTYLFSIILILGVTLTLLYKTFWK